MNIEDKMQEGVALAPLTTFKIGGRARWLAEVNRPEELTAALIWAKTKGASYFILGGGSNILISDQGFDGLVIKINNEQLERVDQTIRVGAGVRLSDVVAMSEAESLSGLEWASGIPGSVGGAVRGNAGAFGHDIKDSVSAVEFLNVTDGQFKIWPAERLNFGYRSSLFKNDPNKIVWSAVFGLCSGDRQAISDLMTQIVDKRLSGQPKFPSAGCVFKNLLATEPLTTRLAADREVRGGKLACGLVIDRLGLKGRRLGGALISPDHANFIVNEHEASAEDVRGLIELVKAAAKREFDLDLEEEIQVVGF